MGTDQRGPVGPRLRRSKETELETRPNSRIRLDKEGRKVMGFYKTYKII